MSPRATLTWSKRPNWLGPETSMHSVASRPAVQIAEAMAQSEGLLDTVVLHINVQGLRSHLAELSAVIRLSASPPDIICVNETFLDEGVEEVALEGYSVAGRRDRSFGGVDKRRCGGIIVFARTDITDHVTLMLTSTTHERMWLQLHTNNGPYLLCSWYRPPNPGEVLSIDAFDTELAQLRGDALGTLVVGDLNLHSKRWLTHSASNSIEGERMRDTTK
jgi:exonuclease III